MKTIKVTFIDTAGHGYYSVSKKDILLVGVDPKLISGFSGQSLTRVYLEEDCDAPIFFDKAKAYQFVVVVKSSYNEHFRIRHNYKADLFAYVPKVGDLLNNKMYEITTVDERGIFIRDLRTKMIYKIGYSNPFEHILDVA